METSPPSPDLNQAASAINPHVVRVLEEAERLLRLALHAALKMRLVYTAARGEPGMDGYLPASHEPNDHPGCDISMSHEVRMFAWACSEPRPVPPGSQAWSGGDASMRKILTDISNVLNAGGRP